jgi:membrane associated rhomboid family serine protease
MHGELWRCVTSKLHHLDLAHLTCNLLTLWSIGTVEQELGPLYYLCYTALLFIMSAVVS